MVIFYLWCFFFGFLPREYSICGCSNLGAKPFFLTNILSSSPSLYILNIYIYSILLPIEPYRFIVSDTTKICFFQSHLFHPTAVDPPHDLQRRSRLQRQTFFGLLFKSTANHVVCKHTSKSTDQQCIDDKTSVDPTFAFTNHGVCCTCDADGCGDTLVYHTCFHKNGSAEGTIAGAAVEEGEEDLHAAVLGHVEKACFQVPMCKLLHCSHPHTDWREQCLPYRSSLERAATLPAPKRSPHQRPGGVTFQPQSLPTEPAMLEWLGFESDPGPFSRKTSMSGNPKHRNCLGNSDISRSCKDEIRKLAAEQNMMSLGQKILPNQIKIYPISTGYLEKRCPQNAFLNRFLYAKYFQTGKC